MNASRTTTAFLLTIPIAATPTSIVSQIKSLRYNVKPRLVSNSTPHQPHQCRSPTAKAVVLYTAELGAKMATALIRTHVLMLPTTLMGLKICGIKVTGGKVDPSPGDRRVAKVAWVPEKVMVPENQAQKAAKTKAKEERILARAL